MNFRLVAATNRDLKAMIAAGTFREDLYYRINSMKLRLPALHERREDIPLLVRFFLDHMGAGETACAEEAMNVLMEYPWPGNIRELRATPWPCLSSAATAHQRRAICRPNCAAIIFLVECRQQGRQRRRADSEAQALLLTPARTGLERGQTARVLGLSRAEFTSRCAVSASRHNLHRRVTIPLFPCPRAPSGFFRRRGVAVSCTSSSSFRDLSPGSPRQPATQCVSPPICDFYMLCHV